MIDAMRRWRRGEPEDFETDFFGFPKFIAAVHVASDFLAPTPPALMRISLDDGVPYRSGELISNSTSADASKNTCFKGRLETVSPSESTELQRMQRSRERIWELAAFQGAEVGLRMLQIPRVFSRQNRD